MTSSVIYNSTGARKNEIYLLNKSNDFKESKDITFDQLLQELNAFECQYILAIRSSPTIFLKRTPNEIK